MGTGWNFHYKQVKGTFSSTFLLLKTSLAPGDGSEVKVSCGVCTAEMPGQQGERTVCSPTPADTFDLLQWNTRHHRKHPRSAPLLQFTGNSRIETRTEAPEKDTGAVAQLTQHNKPLLILRFTWSQARGKKKKLFCFSFLPAVLHHTAFCSPLLLAQHGAWRKLHLPGCRRDEDSGSGHEDSGSSHPLLSSFLTCTAESSLSPATPQHGPLTQTELFLLAHHSGFLLWTLFQNTLQWPWIWGMIQNENGTVDFGSQTKKGMVLIVLLTEERWCAGWDAG